jgi:hypothetical protein
VEVGRLAATFVVTAVLTAASCLTLATASGAAERANHARRPSRCAVAQGLLRAREPVQARREYVRLLKRFAGITCAVDELQELNKPKPKPKPKPPPKTGPACLGADAAFERGDLEQARAAYGRLQARAIRKKLPTTLKCATAGLAASRQVQAMCDRGDVLQDVHRDADARAAFKAALEKNPRVDCVKDGLNDLEQNWLSRFMDGVIGSLDKVLVGIGLALVLTLLTMMLGYWNRARGRLLKLPGVGRLLGPRLALAIDDGATDKKLKAAMEARIRETLQSFRQRALEDSPDCDYDLDVVPAGERFAISATGTSALREALNKAREVSSHSQAVGAILDILYAALPIQRFTLVGVLDPPAAGAASLTLTLEADARLEAAIKLEGRRSGAPTDDDYLELSGPAAVWVQYEVLRVLGRDV